MDPILSVISYHQDFWQKLARFEEYLSMIPDFSQNPHKITFHDSRSSPPLHLPVLLSWMESLNIQVHRAVFGHRGKMICSKAVAEWFVSIELLVVLFSSSLPAFSSSSSNTKGDNLSASMDSHGFPTFFWHTFDSKHPAFQYSFHNKSNLALHPKNLSPSTGNHEFHGIFLFFAFKFNLLGALKNRPPKTGPGIKNSKCFLDINSRKGFPDGPASASWPRPECEDVICCHTTAFTFRFKNLQPESMEIQKWVI